jgi:hypothetical protein
MDAEDSHKHYQRVSGALSWVAYINHAGNQHRVEDNAGCKHVSSKCAGHIAQIFQGRPLDPGVFTFSEQLNVTVTGQRRKQKAE